MTSRSILSLILVAGSCLYSGTTCAWGWGHAHFGPRFGYPYYGYGYGNPYVAPFAYPYPPYVPPLISVIPSAPSTLIQQIPVQPQGSVLQQMPANNWYYCRRPKGYYPYVKACSKGWQVVPTTPQ